MNSYVKRNSKKILLFLVILLIFTVIYFIYPKYQFKTVKYGKDTILVIKKVEPSLQGKFRVPMPMKVKVPKKY